MMKFLTMRMTRKTDEVGLIYVSFIFKSGRPVRHTEMI